ncbi:MAG: hypothetical protein H8D24_02025 [Gammaproteobacteria bacterium]|uniref:Uncharacterized protein n=1 Tax=Candidatus Thiopontia autotrophica TaxID=2841688 RepID=A0A8J6PBQ5_9GAMM|nr:hypothetical protein [Candidatus Thiopontia autotrophica]
MFEQLASLLVYQGLALSPASHWGAVLHFFVMDVAKICVLLLVIYVIGFVKAGIACNHINKKAAH